MSSLKPIAIGSLADEAFEKLTEAISMGELLPGQKLSETSLARQLGISRGPLREALGRLEGRLVERTPRLGVSVMEFGDDDLRELFAVREALDGMACRLAAENATDAELAHLADLVREHSRDPRILDGRRQVRRTADEVFHTQIFESARNSQLAKILEGLNHQLHLYRFESRTRPERARLALQEHGLIVKALKARDPDAAERAMRSHIVNAFQRLELDGGPHARSAEADAPGSRRSSAAALRKAS